MNKKPNKNNNNNNPKQEDLSSVSANNSADNSSSSNVVASATSSSSSSIQSSPTNPTNQQQQTNSNEMTNHTNLNEQAAANLMPPPPLPPMQYMNYYSNVYVPPGAAGAYPAPLDLNSIANWPQAMVAAQMAMSAVANDQMPMTYINPAGYPTAAADMSAQSYEQFGFYPPTIIGYDYNPGLWTAAAAAAAAAQNSSQSVTTSPVLTVQQTNSTNDTTSKWFSMVPEMGGPAAAPVQPAQISPIDSYQVNNSNSYRSYKQNNSSQYYNNGNTNNKNNYYNNYYNPNKLESDFGLLNMNEAKNSKNRLSSSKYNNNSNQTNKYQMTNSNSKRYNNNYSYSNNTNNQIESNSCGLEIQNDANIEAKPFVNDMCQIDANNQSNYYKSDSKTWASIVGHNQLVDSSNLSYQVNSGSSESNSNIQFTTPQIDSAPEQEHQSTSDFSSYMLPDTNYKSNLYKSRKYQNNYHSQQQQQHQIDDFNLNNGAFPPICAINDDNSDAKNSKNNYKRQQYNNYQKQQQKKFGTNATNLNRNGENSESDFSSYQLTNSNSNNYRTTNRFFNNNNNNKNINSTNENDDKDYYNYKRHQPPQLNLSSFMTNLDKSLFIEKAQNKASNSTNNSNTTNKNDKNDYQISINIRSNNLDIKNYNPSEFNTSLKSARFFVIKSYSEEDVYISIKYNVWCSTEHGNRRLDQAFAKGEGNTPVYLFFSVNGSGHFCGMAEMTSRVDYNRKTDLWSQDKWRGCFQVKWIYVKDVPNGLLRNIKLENNDNKPVTNSRDTQEIPFDKGKQVLKVFHTYNHSSSIFDDFEHYEKTRQDDESTHKNEIKSETNTNANVTQHSSIASPYSSSSYSSNSTTQSTEQTKPTVELHQSQFQQTNFVSI